MRGRVLGAAVGGQVLAEWTISAEELIGLSGLDARRFNPLTMGQRITGIVRSHLSDANAKGTL